MGRAAGAQAGKARAGLGGGTLAKRVCPDMREGLLCVVGLWVVGGAAPPMEAGRQQTRRRPRAAIFASHKQQKGYDMLGTQFVWLAIMV
jgi:surfactin synthase thioesterase subunit